MRKIILFIILLFLLLPSVFYTDTVYVSGINIRKLEDNHISIEWKSNTNKFPVLIYRRNGGPVSKISNLNLSVKIYSGTVDGIPDGTLNKFQPYIDTITNTGNFYYAVFSGISNITEEDFKPNINYSILPVQITNIQTLSSIIKTDTTEEKNTGQNNQRTNIEPEINKQIVTNISWTTNQLGVFLFWDNPKPGDWYYSIFRTTNNNLLESVLSNLTPWKKIKNDTFIEDFSPIVGIPYFYTVLIEQNFTILPGVNQNIVPLLFGKTNWIIPVVREAFQSTNLTEKEFVNEFKQ